MINYSRDEDSSSVPKQFGARYAGFARFFDIVNGFFNRCRGAWIQSLGIGYVRHLQMYIWLRLSSALMLQVSSMEWVGCRLMQAVSDLFPGLSLMVWILKREVRAFGGCLGMYRR